MAPLRKKRKDDFDFKRSAADLKHENTEAWFLDRPEEEEEAEIRAGESARFEDEESS